MNALPAEVWVSACAARIELVANQADALLLASWGQSPATAAAALATALASLHAAYKDTPPGTVLTQAQAELAVETPRAAVDFPSWVFVKAVTALASVLDDVVAGRRGPWTPGFAVRHHRYGLPAALAVIDSPAELLDAAVPLLEARELSMQDVGGALFSIVHEAAAAAAAAAGGDVAVADALATAGELVAALGPQEVPFTRRVRAALTGAKAAAAAPEPAVALRALLGVGLVPALGRLLLAATAAAAAEQATAVMVVICDLADADGVDVLALEPLLQTALAAVHALGGAVHLQAAVCSLATQIARQHPQVVIAAGGVALASSAVLVPPYYEGAPLMAHLACSARGREALLAQGALAQLTRLLNIRDREAARSAAYAASAIGILCEDDESGTVLAQAVQGGVFRAAVSALFLHAGVERTCAKVLGMLGALCASPAHRSAALEAGVGGAVLGSLRAHIRNTDAAEDATRVLCQLSALPQARVALEAAGVYAVLAEAQRLHPDNDTVARAAGTVVHRLQGGAVVVRGLGAPP